MRALCCRLGDCLAASNAALRHRPHEPCHRVFSPRSTHLVHAPPEGANDRGPRVTEAGEKDALKLGEVERQPIAELATGMAIGDLHVKDVGSSRAAVHVIVDVDPELVPAARWKVPNAPLQWCAA